MMNVFNLSFGKDSMATLILAAEQGIPIDRVMYCDIRFSTDISGEHPLMADWIPTAEQRIKKLFGLCVDHAYAGHTFCDVFHRKFARGKHAGEIYGFPTRKCRWCNNLLKVRAISRYVRDVAGGESVTTFVGIAADEKPRWEKFERKETMKHAYRSLLVENEITEAQAFEICRTYDLLSPMYEADGIYRGGCWFCPLQSKVDLFSLWQRYPRLYGELENMECISPNRFLQDESLTAIRMRFEAGYIPQRRKRAPNN